MRFLVRVSCLEVYQEVVTDLLCPQRTRLALREDLRQGVHAELLTEETVTSGVHVASVLCYHAQSCTCFPIGAALPL